MRLLWGSVLAIAFVLVAFCTFGAIMNIDGVWYYYPTPERQSAFIRDYSPKRVIDMFESNESSSLGAEMGSGAGQRFVTNERQFDAHFVIESEKRLPLMTALRDDLSANFVHDGAIILTSNGDAGSGFHFTYRLGRNAGSATISPLTIDKGVKRNRFLPEGMQDVSAVITVSEKWFPHEPDSIHASLAAR
jgi:hypothetical protein